MNEEEDEFYDTESEPSFSIDDSDLTNKLSTLTLQVDKTPSTLKTLPPIYAVQFSNKNSSSKSNNVGNGTLNGNGGNRIFINAENAMKLCKQDPDNRRFKVFRNFQEAYSFSYEMREIESGHAPSMEQIQASFSVSISTSQNCTLTFTKNDSSSKQASQTQDAEKLPFSAPKKPEVNEMRLFIERNNFEAFRDKVIANPRFLITAGDAPVIYQLSLNFMNSIN